MSKVKIEFLKDHGIFKKGQVKELDKNLASDMVRYNKDSVKFKTEEKKSKSKK